MNGAPGIYSARYAGAGATDRQNLDRLLDNIARTGTHRSPARYQCVIVYMRGPDDPSPVIAEACWEGYIVPEPKGTNGFGYDPVFLIPAHGCTSAELPAEVKNRISHRGKALQVLLQKLKAAEQLCAQ